VVGVVNCPVCATPASHRFQMARSGKELSMWHCGPCQYDFLDHDPSNDLAANKLDETRLKSVGLDIPTLEKDFQNGLSQSRPYISEYLNDNDRDANILEVGCSWGYFLQLVKDIGASPFGIELNTLRANYVNNELRIPCDSNLEACESRRITFRKIFLFYVLEYIYDPVSYLQRLVNMLEPGGLLVVITPNLNDAIKDLWRNPGFRNFFYDEHAINYMTVRTVERLVMRLSKADVLIETRQGYSFINHVSWFLTQAPRTTGVVGGDNFVEDILEKLQSRQEYTGSDDHEGQLAIKLRDLIGAFDRDYRNLLEEASYGNQIRFTVRR